MQWDGMQYSVVWYDVMSVLRKEHITWNLVKRFICQEKTCAFMVWWFQGKDVLEEKHMFPGHEEKHMF